VALVQTGFCGFIKLAALNYPVRRLHIHLVPHILRIALLAQVQRTLLRHFTLAHGHALAALQMETQLNIVNNFNIVGEMTTSVRYPTQPNLSCPVLSYPILSNQSTSGGLARKSFRLQE